MNEIRFSPAAWQHYEYWQTEDKKILKRINQLIKAASRTPFEGIGKPEPLKGDFSGFWSRRIDDANRLVYRMLDDNDLEIIQCKGHYNDK